MRGVFVDANGSLADIFERLNKPGDPPVSVNRDPDIKPEQMPALLDGAEIVIIDHTALPTDVARRCTWLKHVVFLGTGARSYMNPEELGEIGIEVHLIKGYGDTHKRGTASYRLIEIRIIRPILAGGIPLREGIDAIASARTAALLDPDSEALVRCLAEVERQNAMSIAAE